MPEADVYGGSGWYQLALQAAAEAAQRAMQQWQMMGYQTMPGQTPTREQALAAIYQRVPDAQREKGNPAQAAEKWLKKQGVSDPVAWATQQGYVQAQPETKTPTLEREQWQESIKQQQQQFGEQTQQGREGLGLQYMQLLSQLKGPENWLNYWNVTRAGQNSELPMWATQLAMGRQLPAFQGTTGNIDAANVWLRPNNPGVIPTTSAYNYGTMQNQYQLYNKDGQWQAQNAALGPVQGASALPGGQTLPYVPGYGNAPPSPWYQNQLGSAQYMQPGQQGQPQPQQQGQGYGYVAPNMQGYNMGQQNQGVGMGNNIGANMGYSMGAPAYQNGQQNQGVGMGNNIFQQMPAQQQNYQQMGQQQQNAMAVAMAQNAMNQGTLYNMPSTDSGVMNPNMPATWRPQMPTFQGHQITPQQWNNLNPSEQQGMIAMVEGQQGGWGPDFMKAMQAAWPKGTAKARTFWG